MTIPLQRWCHLFCLRPLRFHQCYSPKYKFPRIFVLHFGFCSKLNGSLIELSKITQLDITGKTVNDRFGFAVLWLVESVSLHHSHFYKISAFYLVNVWIIMSYWRVYIQEELKKRLKSWGRSRIFLKKGVSLRNEVTDGWRKPIFCKILATLESDRSSQGKGEVHTAPLDPPLGRGNHEHDWTGFRRRTHSTPEFKIIKYRQVGLYWLIPKKWNFANKNNLKAVYFLFHRFSIFTC